MNYIDAINKVLVHEGGFVNHPLDMGKATNYGITQAVYEKFKGRSVTIDEMKKMPKSDAIAIYKRDYWDKVRGDEIKFYPVAFALFDQAVNRGVSSAIKQAQKVVGVTQDGVMGPATLSAINSKTDANFLGNYLSLSEDFYRNLVANNPNQSVFLKGWLNRVDSIKSYTSSIIGTISDNKGISAGVIAFIAVFFLIIFNSSKRKA